MNSTNFHVGQEEAERGKIITHFRQAAVLWLASVTIVCVLTIPLAAQAPLNSTSFAIKTIDFSTHAVGPFQPDFYKKDGIVFTEGSFVGFIQGDQALVGPIAATFRPPIFGLSVSVAPSRQGTAEYTLTAADATGRVIGSASMIITEDLGDPTTQPFGYFTIDLGSLPRRAKTFTLQNRFVRSSDPTVTRIDFGVSSITFLTKRP